MNSEEQFKESLKKVLGSKEFPFDESNWEKAMLMRDPEKTKRRIVPYFIAAALLMIIGGVIAYAYLGNNQAPVAAAPPAIQHNKITGANATSPSLPSTSGKALPEAPAASTLPTNPSHATSPDAANLPPEPAMQPKQMTGSTPSQAPVVIATQAAKTTAPAATAVKPLVNEPAKQIARNRVPAETPAPVPNAAPLPVAETGNTSALPESAVDTSNNSPESAPADVPVADNSQAKSQVTANATAADVAANHTPAADAAAHTPVIPVAANNTEQLTTTSSPDAAVTPTTTPQPLVTAGAPTAASKIDSSTVATTAPADDLPKPGEKIRMCFEGGADFLTGWSNAGKREANGFNPVVGINYYNYITNKIAVSIGAQYTSVGNLSYNNHVSKVTRYNLGEQSSVTVITPERVRYLAVPIRFNYFINNNNAIGFGCNVAYLLTVDSKMETYTEGLNRQENYKSSTTQGYTEGFKAFDTQLTMFYRRKLYKNLSVNAELMYGLTDIKDNAFFGSNVYERNSGVKLTLMYNIFR